jgi:superfamily II DNA or RNA helicase/HKD family nuclease
VPDLPPGLYEALVTEALRDRIDALAVGLHPQRGALDTADAADRIALHIARQVERALRDVPEGRRVAVGLLLTRVLLDRMRGVAGAESAEVAFDPREALADPGEVLHAVAGRRPDGSPEPVEVPLTPLLDTTLLTNAPGEPSLRSQLRSEIASADRIDVVMAFIRRSGIRPLLEDLRRHVDRRGAQPGALRVLTTTYTGSTEGRALDALADLGASVRVSYDTGGTRLHAKAWVFHRVSGFSTAYVGSSNLTHAAQVLGREWNVRASAARNPDLVGKFAAVFDALWEGGDFVPYDPGRFQEERNRASRTDGGPVVMLSPLEVRPHPFQVRLLEQLELARRRGRHRNLLVAATGTGKTVVAALDYAALRRTLPRARLLMIAHRREILDQSLATFRHVLREPAFGETWAGGARPGRFEHVFASVQTLASADLSALPADHFDVVVVDEFHHAAAPTYRRVLGHLRPRELLGLTATPERSDGESVLHWFDDRIAAELRLWDAIDGGHLVPFAYHGIHDGLDLRRIPWRRGRGYDIDALSGLYTADDAWARLVVDQVGRLCEPGGMRALGFCVSVAHAHFMARHFGRHGIPAVAVSGRTPPAEREAALRDLAEGRVRVVFSVDLFGEGVDVPAVDTILMLRPTESPTLFLQQLGRGLRRSPDKAFCTVLDFVGTHRTEFRFDRRLRALLGGTRRDVERQVERGFPYLPSGCLMDLDPVAQQVVLRSLREALPTRWPARVQELRAVRDAAGDVDLRTFLAESGLDLEDVYDGGRGWSDLMQAAGVPTRPPGAHEAALRRAVGRMLHVDDDERIIAYRRLLTPGRPPAPGTSTERERRLLRMLVASVAGQGRRGTTLAEGAAVLWAHPQVRRELLELLDVLGDRVEHVHRPFDPVGPVPLQIHARYSRTEILAALGVGSGAYVAPWQTGVYDAAEAGADLLAFTLDKSRGGFSPTTRYRDYALSPTLIHWESQSAVRADSATGVRYRTHARRGRAILLFARLRTDDRAFWFLGPGTYRSHVGERPMAITWELATPLPGDLYARFAAAVA